MKKSIFLLVLLSMVVFCVSAQNFNVTEFANLGKSSLYDFQSYGSNSAQIKNELAEGLHSGAYISKFFRITKSEEDNEDRNVVNYVIRNRLPSFGASEGDSYIVSVDRGGSQTAGYLDGWVLIFRRSSSGTWDYYLYYYSVRR